MRHAHYLSAQEKLAVCYVRFMDDWFVLVPSRWELRRAIRMVHETLVQLQVKQHPDKIFAERNRAGLREVVPPTKKRAIKRVTRLWAVAALLELVSYRKAKRIRNNDGTP